MQTIEVDLERECARFAVQALVATHFFKQKDIDGSGNLDLEEIQQMLHGAFSKEAFAVATEGLDPEDKKYKKLIRLSVLVTTLGLIVSAPPRSTCRAVPGFAEFIQPTCCHRHCRHVVLEALLLAHSSYAR